MEEIVFKPIGYIRSEIKSREGAPIQPSVSEHEGRIEILPEYASGLKDVDGFSHIYVLFNFHLSSGFDLMVKPFLDDVKRGVFSVRAPRRPNQIGLSIVNVIKVEDNVVYFRNADMIDGTPVIDIKPYVTKFDAPGATKFGWIEKKIDDAGRHVADDRFSSRD